MHKFLKAAGFSEYDTEGAIYRLIRNAVVRTENLSNTMKLADGIMLVEYRLPVSDRIGLCAAFLHSEGEFTELEYYYPYYDSLEDSSDAACTVERHTQTETFSGIIDEFNIGLSMIFYVTNPIDFRINQEAGMVPEYHGAALSSFANEATILLPVMQDNVLRDDVMMRESEELLEAARFGDRDAIETLTASDMDMYNQINERIESEDLYSLVEQSFMPCGVECDQYSVIGEILELDETVNSYTGEQLWLIRVSANDVIFRLCIRKADVLGEPQTGRRIKCRLWMQGRVNAGF